MKKLSHILQRMENEIPVNQELKRMVEEKMMSTVRPHSRPWVVLSLSSLAVVGVLAAAFIYQQEVPANTDGQHNTNQFIFLF